MSKPTPQLPFVSVIIPAYNDVRILKCLEALTQQTYDSDLFEILVIDNMSTDGSYESAREEYPNITFLREEGVGSYFCRNTGIAHAKGTLYAFTDADCIPKRDWIEMGVKASLTHPDAGIIGGKIEFFSEIHADQKLSIIEKYDKESSLNQEDFVTLQHFAATANAFITKRAVDKAGAFNQNLRSGGDLEIGKRIFKSGYDVLFEPNAIVLHPARHSLSSVFTRARRIAGGQYQRYYTGGKPFFKTLGRHYFSFHKRNVDRVFNKNKNIYEKVGISSLILLLKVVGAMETIRVKLGGTPERR